MARYKRLETLTIMKEVGVIPVFYNPDFEVAKNVVSACADGGARVVEFTNRGDRAINIFTRIEEFCAKEKPEVVTGVGSIVDAPTAAMYIGAGANFVVGPLTDEETALLCNSRGIRSAQIKVIVSYMKVKYGLQNIYVFLEAKPHIKIIFKLPHLNT